MHYILDVNSIHRICVLAQFIRFHTLRTMGHSQFVCGVFMPAICGVHAPLIARVISLFVVCLVLIKYDITVTFFCYSVPDLTNVTNTFSIAFF